MAGLAKLQGQAWWTGTAIWGTVAAGEFRLFDLTWLAAYPLLLNLATHVSLALELGYPILIWVRVLRPLRPGAGRAHARRDRAHPGADRVRRWRCWRATSRSSPAPGCGAW